jgi:hypothetical protein
MLTNTYRIDMAAGGDVMISLTVHATTKEQAIAAARTRLLVLLQAGVRYELYHIEEIQE